MIHLLTLHQSLIIINKKFNISFKLQKIASLKLYLKDGWHIFVSDIGMGSAVSIVIVMLLLSFMIIYFKLIGKRANEV